MQSITEKLFLEYLSEQDVASRTEYIALGRRALEKEKQLRGTLSAEQTACFEELFELTSQIHFLEVKDAFFAACKMGAAASQEFT